VTAMAGLAVCE